jgi:hypothetical protein
MATLIENTASLPHPNTIDRPPIRTRLRRRQDLAGSVRLPNRSIEMSSLIRSRIGRNGLPHAPAAIHVQGFQRSLVLNNPGNSFSRVRTDLVLRSIFAIKSHRREN